MYKRGPPWVCGTRCRMSGLNAVGAVLSYVTQVKINYGWANANYVYTFFDILIGAIAIYGIVRLLAALRAER